MHDCWEAELPIPHSQAELGNERNILLASPMNTSSSLHFLTACLAVGETIDPAVRTAIANRDIDWQKVCWLAGNHLVTPALAAALHRKGLTGQLPDEVQDYLDGMQALNRERNKILYDELVAVAGRLNRIDIKPLLLKGAIALMPRQYPSAEDRVIGDLDLLVPADRAKEVFALLQQENYGLDPEHSIETLEAHHLPPLLHNELPVSVELHHRFLDDPLIDKRMVEGVEVATLNLPDTDTWVQCPDPSTRLLHNFLHTQIQDKNHAKFVFFLRQLLEFVQLRAYYNGLDWPGLFMRVDPEYHRALGFYLAVAERWFGQAYPSEIKREVGFDLRFQVVERVITKPAWHRLLTPLHRIMNIPRRLLTPAWYPIKIKALWRGEPF